MSRLGHEMLLKSISVHYFYDWFVVIAGFRDGYSVGAAAVMMITLLFLFQLLLHSRGFTAGSVLFVSLLEFWAIVYGYFGAPVYSWKIVDVLRFHFFNFVVTFLELPLGHFLPLFCFIVHQFNLMVCNYFSSAFDELIKGFFQRLNIHNASVIIYSDHWSLIFFLLFLFDAFHILLFLMLAKSL